MDTPMSLALLVAPCRLARPQRRPLKPQTLLSSLTHKHKLTFAPADCVLARLPFALCSILHPRQLA